MKFSLKSVIRGMISGAITDLVVSIPGAWWQWQQAQAMLRTDQPADWGQYLEILLGWFGPGLVLAVPLAILYHAWRSGRKAPSTKE